jgi:hypothetical protein
LVQLPDDSRKAVQTVLHDRCAVAIRSLLADAAGRGAPVVAAVGHGSPIATEGHWDRLFHALDRWS